MQVMTEHSFPRWGLLLQIWGCQLICSFLSCNQLSGGFHCAEARFAVQYGIVNILFPCYQIRLVSVCESKETNMEILACTQHERILTTFDKKHGF